MTDTRPIALVPVKYAYVAQRAGRQRAAGLGDDLQKRGGPGQRDRARLLDLAEHDHLVVGDRGEMNGGVNTVVFFGVEPVEQGLRIAPNDAALTSTLQQMRNKIESVHD